MYKYTLLAIILLFSTNTHALLEGPENTKLNTIETSVQVAPENSVGKTSEMEEVPTSENNADETSVPEETPAPKPEKSIWEKMNPFNWFDSEE